MEGKLIKTGDQFLLRNKDGEVMAITSGTMEGRMLSLKNCQAIENGYDLDEIKRKLFYGFDGQPSSFTTAAVEQTIRIMIEILGDKKFSEFDITKSFEYGWNQRHFGKTDEDELREIQKRFIQSLQQTEWDVVVEMDIDNPCPKCGEKDNVHGNYDYSNITRPLINTLCNECGTYFSPIPKLDADGCLILKRK